MVALVISDTRLILLRSESGRSVDWRRGTATGERHRTHTLYNGQNEAILWCQSASMAGSSRRRRHLEGHTATGDRLHGEYRLCRN